MAFIRQSKVRHAFGQEAKKEFCYENVRPSKCASDGNFVAANGKLLAFCVDAGGGGVFCVIPVTKTGRLDIEMPKVNAHRQYVVDLKWNPYDDSMLASCSEDGSIRIWQFDTTLGLISNADQSKALLSFEYHQKKCIQVSWHPLVSNVMLSVSNKPDIVVWNLDEGTKAVEIVSPSILFGAEWSLKGDKIVTSCKDKKFRIYDARAGSLIVEFDGHPGFKAQRICFTFDDTMLFSTGFSQTSERQYTTWKYNDGKVEADDFQELDNANGYLVPIYDPDTKMMYLIGRGDSVIRYYELSQEAPYSHFIDTYQSKEQQRAIGQIPKRSVDVNICEVMRFYKLIPGQSNKPGSIKPISFTIPRKSEIFQQDLYPDAVSDEAACEAGDWFEGTNPSPNLVKMETFFKGSVKASGNATGGGLKKGGLKGLKAKKDAKASGKSADPAPVAAAPVKSAPVKSSASETKASEPARASTPPRASSSAPAVSSAVDNKVVKELEGEIKTLKDNEKKMQKEIKSLSDKLKDFDKLQADLKLMCDAVKKNDERLNSLEALVQEEDDDEE